MGVLDALRIYASWICWRAEGVVLKWRWTWDRRSLEVVEGVRTADMAYRRDMLTDSRLVKARNGNGRREGRKGGVKTEVEVEEEVQEQEREVAGIVGVLLHFRAAVPRLFHLAVRARG